jgi:hypothetical protein
MAEAACLCNGNVNGDVTGAADAAADDAPGAKRKKPVTAAQQRTIDARHKICHERRVGEKNPLADDFVLKRPYAAAKLIEYLWCDVSSAQLALCQMDCHCSMSELDNWRHRHRREPHTLAKKRRELQAMRVHVAPYRTPPPIGSEPVALPDESSAQQASHMEEVLDHVSSRLPALMQARLPALMEAPLAEQLASQSAMVSDQLAQVQALLSQQLTAALRGGGGALMEAHERRLAAAAADSRIGVAMDTAGAARETAMAAERKVDQVVGGVQQVAQLMAREHHDLSSALLAAEEKAAAALEKAMGHLSVASAAAEAKAAAAEAKAAAAEDRAIAAEIVAQKAIGLTSQLAAQDDVTAHIPKQAWAGIATTQAMLQSAQSEPAKTRAQSAGRAASVSNGRQAPAGCRIYRAAVSRAMCQREAPGLTARALEQGEAITAGQSDGRRVQVDLAVEKEVAASALYDVLKRHGELAERIPMEWRAINSKPGCKEQGMHFDYNPDLVEGRETPLCPKRKPASVCLALEDGARMMVFDRELGKKVTVVLSAGDVLVFDGDVEHAGARYCTSNTRVHVYLDVADVKRVGDYTWTR